MFTILAAGFEPRALHTLPSTAEFAPQIGGQTRSVVANKVKKSDSEITQRKALRSARGCNTPRRVTKRLAPGNAIGAAAAQRNTSDESSKRHATECMSTALLNKTYTLRSVANASTITSRPNQIDRRRRLVRCGGIRLRTTMEQLATRQEQTNSFGPWPVWRPGRAPPLSERPFDARQVLRSKTR